MPALPEVVVARLDLEPHAVRVLADLLSRDERRRATRLKLDRDRRRFIVARARLRALLSERLGTPPESLEFVYGPQGKPALAARFAASGWHFNLSHCEDLAVYAFSRECDTGVDVEALRPLREADAIAARVFSAREHDAYAALGRRHRMLGFFSCWTRKEALMKALGEGFSMPAERLDPSQYPNWRVRNFFPAAGFVAAFAVGQ